MLHTFDSDLEQWNGLETEYVKILYYDLEKNYTGFYYTKSYPRFCTIIDGEKHIEVRNKKFIYNENQSLLLPAHSKVKMTIGKPTKALVFELSDELIDRVTQKANIEMQGSGDVFSKETVGEVLVNNLQRNIREDVRSLMTFAQGNNKESFLIDLYAQKLIYDLLDNKQTKKIIQSQRSHPMETVRQFIENHIRDALTVQEVATYFGMSESNFSHTFKKYMGIQPQKYIHQIKMIQASQLLESHKVTDVSYELGYESLSYFIKIFKEVYGVTPKQYQLGKRQ